MIKTDMSQVIADKIEIEITDSKKVSSKIRKEISKSMIEGKKKYFENSTIREYFKKHEEKWRSNRSNYIRGTAISTQILQGVPVVVDIYPESQYEFEQRYKLSLGEAITLAEDQWIIPNIYVRNPEKWHGKNELLELIKHASVNGVRVNEFMSNRFPNFDHHLKSRTSETKDIIDEMKVSGQDNHFRIFNKLNVDENSAPSVIGNQWAYIECFSPDSSEVFRELIRSDNVEYAIDYLKVIKRLTVSPISAALGGDITWDDYMLNCLYSILNSNLKNKSIVTSSIPEWRYRKNSLKNTELDKFFIEKITQNVTRENLNFTTLQKLSRVTKDEEFIHLKVELHEIMRKLSKTDDHNINELHFKDWEKLSNEIENKIKYFAKGGSISVSMGSCVLGFIFQDPSWVNTISIGMTALSAFDSFKDAVVGRNIHALFQKNNHRFISIIEKTVSRGADNK